MSLFNELKRRNVFRVGIAYIVVAWLVAQVLFTSTVFPARVTRRWLTWYWKISAPRPGSCDHCWSSLPPVYHSPWYLPGHLK